ncbi:MAG: hypothetical protein SGBAC_010235 [Bacillariaceae sp.]
MSATAALEQAMKQAQAPKSGPRQPMINLKRERSFSFELSEFEEASKQIEDSIAFPSIEWSFNDDDEDDLERPSKRSCNRLVRSKGSADLACVRSGSAGSLC